MVRRNRDSQPDKGRRRKTKEPKSTSKQSVWRPKSGEDVFSVGGTVRARDLRAAKKRHIEAQEQARQAKLRRNRYEGVSLYELAHIANSYRERRKTVPPLLRKKIEELRRAEKEGRQKKARKSFFGRTKRGGDSSSTERSSRRRTPQAQAEPASRQMTYAERSQQESARSIAEAMRAGGMTQPQRRRWSLW